MFALVRLISSTPAGWVTDRFGSRKLIIAGLLIVAASSAAVVTANGYWDLLVLRGIGGIGSAAFVVGMGQYLILTIPNRERGRAQGLLQGSFLIGGASGPAVGGLLVEGFGLKAPFLIYAITLGVAALIAVAYIADVRGERSTPAADRASAWPGVSRQDVLDSDVDGAFPELGHPGHPLLRRFCLWDRRPRHDRR